MSVSDTNILIIYVIYLKQNVTITLKNDLKNKCVKLEFCLLSKFAISRVNFRWYYYNIERGEKMATMYTEHTCNTACTELPNRD